MSVFLKNAVLHIACFKKKKVKLINGKPSPNYVPSTVFSRLHEVFWTALCKCKLCIP